MPWIGPVISAGVGLLASNRAASKQASAANRATDLTQEQYAQTREDLQPWMQTGTLGLDRLGYLLGLTNPAMAAKPQAPNRADFITSTPGRLKQDWMSGRKYFVSGKQTFNEDQFNRAMEQYQRDMLAWDQQMAGERGDSEFGSLLEPFTLDKFEESPAYQFNLGEGMKAINKATAARGDYYAPTTLKDIGKYAQGVASNEFQNAYNNYNTNMENIWRRLSGQSESGRGAATQVGDLGSRAAGSAAATITGAGNAQAAGIMGGANAIAGGIGSAYNNYLQQQILSQMQNPTYNVQRAPSGSAVYTPIGV